MSRLRQTFLILAIAGAIVPLWFFVGWLQTNGFDLGELQAAWRVNDATRGLVWELIISAIALSVFIISETVVRRDYWVLLCIPATLCVGVSFGFPLYLFLRSRPID